MQETGFQQTVADLEQTVQAGVLVEGLLARSETYIQENAREYRSPRAHVGLHELKDGISALDGQAVEQILQDVVRHEHATKSCKFVYQETSLKPERPTLL
jgi:hypothetical protein